MPLKMCCREKMKLYPQKKKIFFDPVDFIQFYVLRVKYALDNRNPELQNKYFH